MNITRQVVRSVTRRSRLTLSTTSSSSSSGNRSLSLTSRSSSYFSASSYHHHHPCHRLERQSTRSFSAASSFDEPNPTLFATSTAAATVATHDPAAALVNRDMQLRSDIRMMGSLLGKVIQEHTGPDIYRKIEDMRHLAKAWREAGAGRVAETASVAQEQFDALTTYAASLSDQELYWVSRGFTHFLSLANSAEAHHRSRLLSQADTHPEGVRAGALHPKKDSCGVVFQNLMAAGHSAEDIWKSLSSQWAELVLTAHPTEVNRRTILEKKGRIKKILQQADRTRSTGSSPFDKMQLDDAMYREISSIWLSDEVSRFKPTPQTEAAKGTLVVETVLWEAVPRFIRKLDATCREFLGKGVPLEAAPIRFASWMGGDRDGNPNVKADTTREVCLANRAKAASLVLNDLMQLERELSLTTCSKEVRAIVGDEREPYRSYLRPVIEKLKLTLTWVDQEMDYLHQRNGMSRSARAITPQDIYLSREDLMKELMTIHRSLCQTGNEVEADGILTDIIRNLSSFGLTLVPLDVRQESDRHEEAVDAITRYLGLGSFSQWDEETKINWLTTQISSKRPLIRPGVWKERPDIFPETAAETLETFQMIAEQHADSLGAYVISQATTASDVLSVLLLQLDAGRKDPLRVVPLFETLDDLNGAESTMKKLFSLPVYMGIINGKQEVMIGYSDSAKDAGRLAASWAQFVTQEKLAAVAKQHDVNLTFFHGKGGTVGRGGNPQTFLAITSHPPETINGKFRVTEQGEMIFQNFGDPDRAERTMDIYTAAVLTEKLTKRPKPNQQYRDMMDKLSEISCAAYRKVVRGDDRFVPYFRSATPELELSSLKIGSRPAKRKATGGVESLRAIPWNFAWTQTRLNLPSWLGVGNAFEEVLKSEEAPLLIDMYQNFDSFRTMVDLVEMVLSKSEPAIAAHYEDTLVFDPKAKELGSEVRKTHLATEAAILQVAGHATLGENNAILRRGLLVRNPYVDCLNVLQAETLKRTRQYEDGELSKELQDALMTTIGGIAHGMGNTG